MSETEKAHKQETFDEKLKRFFRWNINNIMLSAGEFGLLIDWDTPFIDTLNNGLGFPEGTLAANLVRGIAIGLPSVIAGVGWARMVQAESIPKEKHGEVDHPSFFRKYLRDQLLLTGANLGLAKMFELSVRYSNGDVMNPNDANLFFLSGAAAIIGQAFGGTWAYFAAGRKEKENHHKEPEKKEAASRERPANITITNSPVITPHVSPVITPQFRPELSTKNESSSQSSSDSVSDSKADSKAKQSKKENNSSHTDIHSSTENNTAEVKVEI